MAISKAVLRMITFTKILWRAQMMKIKKGSRGPKFSSIARAVCCDKFKSNK